jgi:O-antigen/teichoic acid export membrane protein
MIKRVSGYLVARSEKIIYLLFALLGKVLKSSFEIMSLVFLSSIDYAKLIPIFNQSQIAATWILAGFGSSAYQYFSTKDFRLRLIVSITVLVVNAFLINLVATVFGLYESYGISKSALVVGMIWAIITGMSVFLRSSGRLLRSVIVLEVIPFVSLIFTLFINSRLVLFAPVDIFTYTLAMSLCAGLIVVLLLDGKLYRLSLFNKKTLYHYRQYFIVTAPFAIVSCTNVVLSRIDTTVIRDLVNPSEFASYTVSVRFSALILTIGNIFRHYYLAKITNLILSNKMHECDKQLMLYMRDTFGSSCLALACMYLSIHIGLLNWIGLEVEIPIFLAAAFLCVLISPLTIFTYVLVLTGNVKIVTMSAIGSLFLSITVIMYLGVTLDVGNLPYILFGAVLTSKLIEVAYYARRRIVQSKQC